jgi:membrane protease YdiL (CAAX protease family)
MLASAEPAPGRKFLRALRCPRDAAGRPCGAVLGAATLGVVDAQHAQARLALNGPDGLVAALGPGLLLVGALVPDLRPVVAFAIVAGWTLLVLTRRPGAIAWAAALPLAVVLTWPWVLGADVPVGDPECRDVLSAIALRRMAVAVVGLAIVGLLAVVHRSGRSELGLGRPGRVEAVVAVGGCLVLVAGGLVIGPAIARPFFGELDYPVPLGALIPAILFGVANGVLEEVLYRGALQAWLARLAPIGWMIVFQGLVFGIVLRPGRRAPHTGRRPRPRGSRSGPMTNRASTGQRRPRGARAAPGPHRPAHRRRHRGRRCPVEARFVMGPDRDPRGRGRRPVCGARLPGRSMRPRRRRSTGIIAP